MLGVPFFLGGGGGGPHSKDYSILGSILGTPTLWWEQPSYSKPQTLPQQVTGSPLSY